jgi:hypothetical protein
VLAPGETLTGLPFSGSEPFIPPIVGGGGGGGAGSFTVCAVNFDINTRTILSISTAAIDEADLVFSPLTGPCPADVGSQGGLTGADGSLDNNDFVVFIDAFFNSNPLADMGVQGGARGSDGLFDNNDFVAFIDQFFTPC